MYLYLKKARTVPKCGQCKEKLKGIQPTRPSERPRLSRRLKTVSRTFGGVLCHRCLRERIIRAFLIDEQKLVKVLKAQQATTVKTSPRVAKPTKQAAAPKTAPSKTPAPAPKVAGKTGKVAKPTKAPAAKPSTGGKKIKK